MVPAVCLYSHHKKKKKNLEDRDCWFESVVYDFKLIRWGPMAVDDAWTVRATISIQKGTIDRQHAVIRNSWIYEIPTFPSLFLRFVTELRIAD